MGGHHGILKSVALAIASTSSRRIIGMAIKYNFFKDSKGGVGETSPVSVKEGKRSALEFT